MKRLICWCLEALVETESEARWKPEGEGVVLWIKKYYPNDIQVLLVSTSRVVWSRVDGELKISNLFGKTNCYLLSKPAGERDPRLNQRLLRRVRNRNPAEKLYVVGSEILEEAKQLGFTSFHESVWSLPDIINSIYWRPSSH